MSISRWPYASFPGLSHLRAIMSAALQEQASQSNVVQLLLSPLQVKQAFVLVLALAASQVRMQKRAMALSLDLDLLAA